MKKKYIKPELTAEMPLMSPIMLGVHSDETITNSGDVLSKEIDDMFWEED